jgi:UDPglucose 6-dehydrogenase/UDP-N-acetyl-D-galactosamine dehydrogenase
MRDSLSETIVCIIGLGYVGLPLAEAFARNFKVIGFDIDSDKVKKLSQSNNNQNLLITDNPGGISQLISSSSASPPR